MNILRERQQKATEEARKKAVAIIDLNMGEGLPESETERFKTEAIIMPDGYALIMLPSQMGIPPIPIEYDILKRMYEAATTVKKKSDHNSAAVSEETNESHSIGLEKHKANNWPHPHISGTYLLPSGTLRAFVDRCDNSITLLTLSDSAIINLKSEDIVRLSGIHSPSVLPDGPCGCPVPKEEEEKKGDFQAAYGISEGGRLSTWPVDYLERCKDGQLVQFFFDLTTPVPEGKQAIYAGWSHRFSMPVGLHLNVFSKADSAMELLLRYGKANAQIAVGFVEKK